MSKQARTNIHLYEAIAAVTAEMLKECKDQQQGYQFRGAALLTFAMR